MNKFFCILGENMGLWIATLTDFIAGHIIIINNYNLLLINIMSKIINLFLYIIDVN